jgi:hypothetical protein
MRATFKSNPTEPLTPRAGHFEPGLYAIEVLGDLPDEAIEECESRGAEYRKIAKQNK